MVDTYDAAVLRTETKATLTSASAPVSRSVTLLPLIAILIQSHSLNSSAISRVQNSYLAEGNETALGYTTGIL